MDLSVSLPEDLSHYVETKMSSGRYASSSDVVREALRLMESRERSDAERLQHLRDAWQDGLQSGDAGEIDFTALKVEARAQMSPAKP